MAIPHTYTLSEGQPTTTAISNDSPPQNRNHITQPPPTTIYSPGGHSEYRNENSNPGNYITANPFSQATKDDEIQITGGRKDGVQNENNNTIRKECGTETNSDPDDTHNSKSKGDATEQPSRLRRTYILFKTSWKAFQNRVKRKLSRARREHDDDYYRTILVAVRHPTTNQEECRVGSANFDTGNPYNLMSQEFAGRYGYTFKPKDAVETLELPGGTKFSSVGTVEARWCAHKPKPGADQELFFDRKFKDITFKVSAGENETWDLIIGRETINKERLMKFKLKLAFTGSSGFRKSRASASNASADDFNKQENNRAKNTADKAANEKKKEEEKKKKGEEAEGERN